MSSFLMCESDIEPLLVIFLDLTISLISLISTNEVTSSVIVKSPPIVTSSGKDNVIEFAPFVTVISFEVPLIVAAAGPSEPPIINCPFDVNATEPTASVPLSCEIKTALSVKDVAPIPPCATGPRCI